MASTNELSSPPADQSGVPFKALIRGWPVVVLVGLLVAAAAVAASLTQATEYRATGEVIVSNGATRTSSDPARILATQARLARLPSVASRAVRIAGVHETTDELLKNSTVTPNSDADVLEFAVTNSTPGVARKLADAYAEAFVQFGGQRRQRPRRNTGTVLGPPAAAAEKTQPLPFRNGLLGAALGVVLGIGLLFARDALNTRVRNIEDAERHLGVPLLGRIPTPPKRLANPISLSSLAEPSSPQAEAYRMLATSIEVANLDRGATSFIVVSAIPDEGKTTTIANLAVAFARQGLDVLLMEADLRRGQLSRFFDITDGPALAEVVLGRASLADALTTIELPNDLEGAGPGSEPGRLEVLAATPATPATPTSVPPGDLLQTEAVGELIMQLNERADLLLIDSPPLLQVSDARNLMLSGGVDCALIAVRLGGVKRAELLEMNRMLSATSLFTLGFFATGVGRDDDYAGGYGYGDAPT
jgi:capsular exopolysaccharide synthesis family protein